MGSVIQRSFAGGVLTTDAAARADQAKYATGLRTCRNFHVLKHGGVSNRAGFDFIDEVKDSSDTTRLLKFVFNADQTYVLELGDLYMRFYQNGARLAVSGVAAWSGVTAYAIGDLVTSGGITYYCVLAHTNHVPPNGTYWYALSGSVYEIPTPYASGDLAALQFKQSGDIVTIVSRDYAPRELARLGQTQWTLTVLDTGSPIDAPGSVVASAGTPVSSGIGIPLGPAAVGGDPAGPPVADRYRVAAYDDSPTILGVASTIAIAATGGGFASKATAAFPMTVSWGAVAGAVGYVVYKLHRTTGQYGAIAITAATSFNDTDAVVAGYAIAVLSTVAAGGTLFTYVVTAIDDDTGAESVASAEATCTGSTPSASAPNVISWAAVTGASSYNVYRKVDGTYSFIGTATGTSFDDVNYDPNTSINPPVDTDPFGTAGNYPQAIGYFQQREVLASTDNDPERVRFSRTGDFRNFNISSPLQDDDSVSFICAGDQVHEVRHVFEVGGRFVMLTAGGEWTIGGDQAGTLTPTAINLRQQGYTGAAKNLRPLVIDNTALFVQARGTSVIDLGYDITVDGYKGSDLTVFAQHLFQGHELLEWDYARQPHSIVWAVRDDGALLGLTYLKEHAIWGWHEHDTGDGDAFESAVVVPEGDEDVLYVIVRRTIGGATKRYIERMHTRVMDVPSDAFFVDSGLTYDGTNTGSTTLTLSGGTTWSIDEDLVLTASGAQFIAGDVGNEYHLFQVVDEDTDDERTLTLRVEVTVYISPTVVTVRALRTVDEVTDEDGTVGEDYSIFQTGARATWARAVDEVTGLTHLEGRTVAICADGAEEPQVVVASGTVALNEPAAIIHVGLPITADIELLDLEDPQGETLTGRKKLIVEATALVKASGPFSAGPDEDHLKPAQLRDTEAWDDPTALETGPVSVRLSSTWDNNGRILIRQTSPLPLEVLAVVRTGELGGKR